MAKEIVQVEIKRIPLDIETTELGAVELTDLAATVEKYMQGLDEIDTLKQALITALHFAAVAYLQRQNDGGKRKEADMIKSAVFFGPPGCGKTATARYIASRTQSYTVELNAAAAGVADIKKVLAEAKERARTPSFDQKRTLVILDEIHHFNKTQQDVLLPSVERGDIILIGITTENPYFYINTALLSRFSVFEFKALGEKDLLKILTRAAEKEMHKSLRMPPNTLSPKPTATAEKC